MDKLTSAVTVKFAPDDADDSNLVTACRDCNRSKGARTPEQWRGA